MISLLGPPPQKLLDRADSGMYFSLYTTQGMYGNASADGCLRFQVNSNIQNSLPLNLSLFRITHPSSKERISDFSSNLHPRCFDGFQRSDRLQKSYTTILGSIFRPEIHQKGGGEWRIPALVSQHSVTSARSTGRGAMQVGLAEKSLSAR